MVKSINRVHNYALVLRLQIHQGLCSVSCLVATFEVGGGSRIKNCFVLPRPDLSGLIESLLKSVLLGVEWLGHYTSVLSATKPSSLVCTVQFLARLLRLLLLCLMSFLLNAAF